MTQHPLNIKFKALTVTLGWPLFWATILVIKLFYPNFLFNLGITLGLLLGSIIRLFFIDRRYLISFIIENGEIKILYLTQFLRQKEFSISTDQVVHLEYEKRNWIVENFNCLSLTDKKIWMRFQLLDKKIKTDTKKKIEMADNIKSQIV